MLFILFAHGGGSSAGSSRAFRPHVSIGRTDNTMTKIALTKAPTSLLECPVYILLAKNYMPLDIDRPITSAVVVGCAISATCNYLKFNVQS
jgi:hypothetical protein